MAQNTGGVRRVLSVPVIYDLVQNLMGGGKARRQFVEEFVRPELGARILDFGCGTGVILSYLPEQIEYWGYDISRDYIDAAKAEFGTRGHFTCGLISRELLADLPKFDIVLALGVLHHLDDLEATTFFDLARQALGAAGRVVTIDPCFSSGQNPIARFLISRDRGQNVRDSQGYLSLTQHSFNNVRGTLRHRAWIPYTHWIMECSS